MRYYLAFWCTEGFELLRDVTEEHPDIIGQEQLMDVLSDKKPTNSQLGRLIDMLTIRGHANPDREYESYLFMVTDDVSDESVIGMADTSPQYLVDFIRENGTKIFSFKKKREAAKIV